MNEEQNGQQPQAGAQATPQPQVGTNPPADPQVGEAPSGLTLEQALDALKKVRAEAASQRVKLNEFEQQQQEAERAKLSKEEQLSAKIADMERAHSERERQYQETVIAHAVEKAAVKLGVVDPDAAAKLLDMSQLEFDEDGKPKNAEKLLRDMLQARPYLAGTPSVSPTNPNLNHAQAGQFTESQLADLNFYNKNRAAIKQAMREGRIIKG